MASASRKVRMACRRCRTKRVKCDGNIPACGNCAKAGAPCIDVDGRNNDLSIPRDFVIASRARIRWLEDQIRLLEPDFDLSQGPQLTASAPTGSTLVSEVAEVGLQDDDLSMEPPPDQASQASIPETSPHSTESAKRPYSQMVEADVEAPVSDEARSVAVDLGMLSLNSDSRQKHYLGSSSGLLFTRLIGAESSPQASSQTATDHRPRPSASFARHGQPIARSSKDQEASWRLYSKLRQELPDKEQASLLLDVYFREIHKDHPFIHPGSLIKALQALYSCSELISCPPIGPNGWPVDQTSFSYNGEMDVTNGINSTPVSASTAIFHVFMIFSVASTLLTRKRNYDYSPTRFYRTAMLTASDCFASTSLPALQSILLLTVHSLIGPADVNVWTLIHIAMAHCIDLGLHREPNETREMTNAALNSRRLVFYTVYSLDRSISTIQGRPLGIRDETFDIGLPNISDLQADYSNSSDSFLEFSVPVWPMLFSLHRFKLDKYISDIKLLLYHLPGHVEFPIWPDNPTTIQEKIKTNLQSWADEISALFSSVPASQIPETHGYALKLEAQYHAAMTLLYQPSQVFRNPSEYALSVCYHSSSKRLRIYKQLNDSDALNHSWRSVQAIFASGATMIYSFWASKPIRSSVPSAETLRDLRICSNMLSVGGEWWPSVKKGKESFERMVDLTVRKLSDSGDSFDQQRIVRQRTQHQHNPLFTERPDVGRLPPNGGQDRPYYRYNTFPDLVQGSTARQPDTLMPNLGSEASQNFDQAPLAYAEPDLEGFLAEYLHGDFHWDPFADSFNDLGTH